MPFRPSQLWKDLSPEQRLAAADAFWRDTTSPEVEAQHVEAVLMLARRLKFRTKSIQHQPVERRAKQLAQVGDVSEGIAIRALIAYHFASQRPLMAAFLDALGIEHEGGLIAAEEVEPPTVEQLTKAAGAVRTSFPPADVDSYLRTLSALDGETWAGVESILPLTA